jgi:hypothetical protein
VTRQLVPVNPSVKHFFKNIFLAARVCRPLLRLWRPFMIFEGCLDSNPEYCRSKLARYRLSHPSLYLAIHPSISQTYTAKESNFSMFFAKKNKKHHP